MSAFRCLPNTHCAISKPWMQVQTHTHTHTHTHTKGVRKICARSVHLCKRTVWQADRHLDFDSSQTQSLRPLFTESMQHLNRKTIIKKMCHSLAVQALPPTPHHGKVAHYGGAKLIKKMHIYWCVSCNSSYQHSFLKCSGFLLKKFILHSFQLSPATLSNISSASSRLEEMTVACLHMRMQLHSAIAKTLRKLHSARGAIR